MNLILQFINFPLIKIEHSDLKNNSKRGWEQKGGNQCMAVRGGLGIWCMSGVVTHLKRERAVALKHTCAVNQCYLN